MDMMHVPWLEKLLTITTFFTTCEVHPNDPKNECNKFCLDCNDNPLCGSCIKSHHNDHQVIQIRRSSYNEAVKTNDIYKHVDILGIQTYVINGSTIVFLNKRPQPHSNSSKIGKIGQSCKSHCKTCDRNLVDSSCFCSLACKFAYIKKDGGFFENPEKMEEQEKLLKKSIKVSSLSKEKAGNSREQNLKRKVDEAEIDEENEDDENDKEQEDNKKEDNKEVLSVVIRPSGSFRKPNSRRKGIPYRAPFF